MINLYDETMRLLKASSETPKQISDATELGKRWLERLSDGDYKEPGVNKIQRLHTYLKKQSKKVA